MSEKKPVHSHPVLRDAGLPPKKVSRRLIVKVDDEMKDSTEQRPVRKKRVGCCG